jgi:uncharacterized delta-60 repeat protein
MSLTLRSQKGSPLTFSEMDGNLTYLEELAQQGGGGGGSSYYDNGNSSQNTVIDWSRANLQELGIDNDPTLSFTGATAGQKLTLLLSRGVGESRVITWSDGVFWRDGEEFNLKKVNSVALDEGFEIGDGFDDSVRSIALQPDGGILVGGEFTEFDGDPANGLARLNADGTLDEGFGIGDGFDGSKGAGQVLSIALQSDGGILVGGQFTEFDGNPANGLARLNADGTLDEGFGIGDGFDGDVYSIALQPDGGILVGGDFTEFDGGSANNMVRLNADGTRDSGFGIGDGFNNSVYSIAMQPDGGILVGGFFTEFDGDPANGLARLNADGTLDEGFGIGDGFDGDVYSIALQPDGGILAGGDFTEFDGNPANFLVRLNADGSIDTGFGIGTGFDKSVRSIALQSDGKVLVGGGFTSFDGNPANFLVRLNADGSLDSGFDIGAGFDKSVQAIALQPDGGILAGGDFTSFDGNPANFLVRLVELTGDIYTPVDLYWTGARYIGDYSSDS